MYKTYLKKGLHLLLFVLLISCSKNTNGGSTTPINPVTPTSIPKLMTLPNGWKLSSILSANFPSGIELYYYDSIYAGRKTKMFYCIG